MNLTTDYAITASLAGEYEVFVTVPRGDQAEIHKTVAGKTAQPITGAVWTRSFVGLMKFGEGTLSPVLTGSATISLNKV